MIARSDLVILAISGTLLATGIYRWQSNLHPTATPSTIAGSAARNLPGNSQTANDTGSSIPLTANTSTSSATGIERDQLDSGAVTPTRNSGSSTDSASNAASSSASNTLNTNAAIQAPGDSTQDDAALYGTYIVEPGDSLSAIADNHGTSVDTLRIINKINGSLIYVDQKILYPLPAN